MNRGKRINLRKNIDYSEMYKALDMLMQKEMSQMEPYYEIGKVVCRRTEKSTAVMASKYLNKQYPDVKGFSPWSLRRMRDFYRPYENHPALLYRAIQLGWIQNVVIMEAELTMELREWYMKAVKQFGWSKTELIANIVANSYNNIVFAIEEEICYIGGNKEMQTTESQKDLLVAVRNVTYRLVRIKRKWWLIWRESRQRWYTILLETSIEKRTTSMQC